MLIHVFIILDPSLLPFRSRLTSLVIMGRVAKSDLEKAKIKSTQLEIKMKKAVDAYRAFERRPDGKRKSLRDLADDYDVSPSALCRHVNGGISIARFNITKQKLSELVEFELEGWCMDLADRSLAITNALLEEKAN